MWWIGAACGGGLWKNGLLGASDIALNGVCVALKSGRACSRLLCVDGGCTLLKRSGEELTCRLCGIGVDDDDEAARGCRPRGLCDSECAE